ncbi:hypothetical protein [Ruficoccus sp. ZRK36]|nr:hypothetical protein [Ruficoccus sp. ZRK36]QYY36252.1 hypothetical protein K0V07_02015 [Ruficoccus sp. ZRK36]
MKKKLLSTVSALIFIGSAMAFAGTPTKSGDSGCKDSGKDSCCCKCECK